MEPSLLILLAPLIGAAVVSALATVREGDLRHAALLALTGLLGAHALAAPPVLPALPALPASDAGAGAIAVVLDPRSVPYLLMLCVHLATLWAALALVRTLHERNRAEQVHERDLETLRDLADTLRGLDPRAPSSAAAILALGCRRFDLETGLLARIGDDEAEILAVLAPDDAAGIAPGPCPDLARTLAVRCALGDDVVAVDQASAGHWGTHPEHAPFGWDAFLGARIDGDARGARVLCFASRRARPERTSAAERHALRLMASWLAPVAAPRQDDPDKPLVPTAPASDAELDPRLRGLERRLRGGLGAAQPLELDLGAGAQAVALGAGELERIVASLLRCAADAAPDGAPVFLRTRYLAPGEPGTPGFVTVALAARGPALDADALAALYEQAPEPVQASGLRQLPLARVVRLLRDAGGDLSMESEEGLGTTLTAFLPTAPAEP